MTELTRQDHTSPPSERRGPAVSFPPPLLFVAALALAWWLNTRLTFEIDGAGVGRVQGAIGLGAVAGGLALMYLGIITFLRARTAIYPNQPARALVTTGPYRFSRNPMYLGLTAAYFGLSLLLNWAWPLVLLPFVLGGLSAFVIDREEKYLAATFGTAYKEYCRHVRRWF